MDISALDIDEKMRGLESDASETSLGLSPRPSAFQNRSFEMSHSFCSDDLDAASVDLSTIALSGCGSNFPDHVELPSASGGASHSSLKSADQKDGNTSIEKDSSPENQLKKINSSELSATCGSPCAIS